MSEAEITIKVPQQQAIQLLQLAKETAIDIGERRNVPAHLSLGQAFERLRLCENLEVQLNGVSDRVTPGTLPPAGEVG